MSATARKSTDSRGAKAPVLQLVPSHSRTDASLAVETAKALRELARQADEGELVGFAYVALRQDRSKDTVGAVGLADHCADRAVFWLHRLIVSFLRN